MDSLLGLLGPLLEAYAGKFGVVIQVLTYIGSARLILKPLNGLADSIVAATPSDSDDKKLSAFRESKGYKLVIYLLDWLGSIKIKK